MRGRYTESIQCRRPSLKERQCIICKMWVELCPLAVCSQFLCHITCGGFSSDSAIGRNFYCFDCTVFSLWCRMLAWRNLLVLGFFFTFGPSHCWMSKREVTVKEERGTGLTCSAGRRCPPPPPLISLLFPPLKPVECYLNWVVVSVSDFKLFLYDAINGCENLAYR